MSLSVVVPVYNSEHTLTKLVTRMETVLEAQASKFELILVNDGSRDRSWDVIEMLTANYTWVKGINLMRNYGQHNALLCGIREAQFETIITMDDDCQNPPEEIPKLLEKIHSGFDVIYGTPQNEQHDFWRRVASQFTKIALRSAMGTEVARKVSAFRAFRTPVREAFALYRGAFVNIDVLLSWATTRFTSVVVSNQPREIGKSNYTFRRLIVHALNMITGFSMVPLQIASIIGFLFTIIGIVILCYVFASYLIYGGVVPGFAFLASIIAIFSGAQLFSLGIIGEYLARMHFRLMERPTYVIERIKSPAPSNPNNMANSTVCELLLWDTDFFGFRIGRVHEHRLSEMLIRYIMEWEKSNSIDCLYFLAEFGDPTTIQLAHTHQFQLVDIRVILERDLQRYQELNPYPTGKAIIRPFQTDDIPILESIAKTSHTDSRFYFDKNFPRDKCGTLYEIWIRRSCEGFADQVLVAELSGVVVGYITCEIINDITGNIGLVGVGEQARGQGIGKSLVRAALDWFATKNLQSVQLATQGRNISAQRLCQSCGFMTHSVQLWYHRWGKKDKS